MLHAEYDQDRTTVLPGGRRRGVEPVPVAPFKPMCQATALCRHSSRGVRRRSRRLPTRGRSL